MSGLAITRCGGVAMVQDGGRPGYRHLGVPAGGALDEFAARVANILVGNEPEAAVLETTFGSLTVRFEDERVVAWCGGAFAVRHQGRLIEAGRAVRVSAGDEVAVGLPDAGCRLWLAVSGGIAVPPVLGSRSTDLRGGFGGHEGRILRRDDRLPLGPPGSARSDGMRPGQGPARPWVAPTLMRPRLRCVRGVDWEEFNGPFFGRAGRVSSEADRMGMRLEGLEVARRREDDLLSKALVPGTVQVLPGGDPILLLSDCQTIGGYPQLAHVVSVDLPVAAQLRPGDEVVFEEISRASAQEMLLERERALQKFRVGLRLAGSP